MPRAKSPCGTYTAYKRHLREHTPVDAACRAAQKLQDGGRSTSAASRVRRTAAKKAVTEAPVSPTPTTDEGHVSRLEVLKEMLEDSRSTLKALRRLTPDRAYLASREQREILAEIATLQGNGQVKGVTLADQLADVRARRRAGAAAS